MENGAGRGLTSQVSQSWLRECPNSKVALVLSNHVAMATLFPIARHETKMRMCLREVVLSVECRGREVAEGDN